MHMGMECSVLSQSTEGLYLLPFHSVSHVRGYGGEVLKEPVFRLKVGVADAADRTVPASDRN